MKASDLLIKIEESSFTINRSLAIRDGKRVKLAEKEYKEPTREGYKRDEDGREVRMTLQERTNRSKAATKAANDPITKRNKKVSDQRRKALGL